MNRSEQTPQEPLEGDNASTMDGRAARGTLLPPESSERHYLLVFDGDSARMFALPEQGEVVIGRGDGADLKLCEASVSRAHAKVSVTGGQVRIADLESQNGTHVNEERVVGTRRLSSGDVVTLSSATLVLHLGRRATTGPLFVDPATMRQRVEAELERALRYFRPFSVLHVSLGTKTADRPRVELALQAVCRGLDVASWTGADSFSVALPELDDPGAREHALRILEALEPLAPAARAGVAACPSDGCDVDTLHSSASAAARTTAAGDVASGRDAFQTLKLGDREVLIADPVMMRLYGLAERIARSDLPVLVNGETGAGKELAASALHFLSHRKAQRLVTLNCAALQESLLESELFGHEKGAFTHATATKMGLFEAASGGTLFLDEVGELSLSIQAKLLRALDTQRITRLGDVKERVIDVRVVAATNRDLEAEIRAGRFRQDLFFRLSGSILWLPPLRERKRELPILARAFLLRACERSAREPLEISDAAMQRLALYPWPGNVRELRNVMDYAAAAVTEEVLEPWHLDERLGAGFSVKPSASTEPALPAQEPTTLPALTNLAEEIQTLERTRMTQALHASEGNQTRAAQRIGMPLRTFVTKMKQYGLRGK
ncbi:sigma 54-interacting transcriptional regulator [Myxococcus llanfairpwllgwyngyllgogerychwyrndrobwllllantysiliogogogochensis]|nr:sigma 54-interacting transcriptional regulator [Myxococcus llanfairpwllgwyngyllgogerychwyrndrobwllllantysiliogogogochensis]